MLSFPVAHLVDNKQIMVQSGNDEAFIELAQDLLRRKCQGVKQR